MIQNQSCLSVESSLSSDYQLISKEIKVHLNFQVLIHFSPSPSMNLRREDWLFSESLESVKSE